MAMACCRALLCAGKGGCRGKDRACPVAAGHGHGRVDLDAAGEAGRQLATEGSIAPVTLQAVSRALMPEEVYVRPVNDAFAQIIAAQQGAAG